jgi:benzoyl-CoA reductase/2-hydroxyglutaryl-CoA dehydratase subunit BcrC/BadD/HgdB
MQELQALREHIAARSHELARMKQAGIKMVGYIPDGYIPEELIYASGAMPVVLLRGGEPDVGLEAQRYAPRFFTVFHRNQLVYRLDEKEPLYQLPDLFVHSISDRDACGVSELWEYYTHDEIFRVGIPKNQTSEAALEYYLESIQLLKGRLERLTGNLITEERLKREIGLCNRIRGLLKEISDLRKSKRLPISGKDFVLLNHYSFIADRQYMVGVLESISQELKTKKAPPAKGLRILLIGSTVAVGDYRVIDMLEAAGAQIVIEHFDEGMRRYEMKVEADGDPMKALADAYFRLREPPPAYQRPATKARNDFYLKLIKEFKIDGVVWYTLLYRNPHHIEGAYFEQILKKETGLPMLELHSDYDIYSEGAAFRTRIESFVEMLKKKRKWER